MRKINGEGFIFIDMEKYLKNATFGTISGSNLTVTLSPEDGAEFKALIEESIKTGKALFYSKCETAFTDGTNTLTVSSGGYVGGWCTESASYIYTQCIYVGDYNGTFHQTTRFIYTIATNDLTIVHNP